VCILSKDLVTELERFVCRGSDRCDLVCLLKKKKVYLVNDGVCGPVVVSLVSVRDVVRDMSLGMVRGATVRTMALLRLDSASELREWN